MHFIQKNVLACKMLISNLAGELLHTTAASKKSSVLLHAW